MELSNLASEILIYFVLHSIKTAANFMQLCNINENY